MKRQAAFEGGPRHPPASPSAALARAKADERAAADADKAAFASEEFPSEVPLIAGGSPDVTRTESWRDFEHTDPLYALIGELGENRVVQLDGFLDEVALECYIMRLMEPGIVEKPKSWVEIWAAMNIPVTIEAQSTVIKAIIRIGLESEESIAATVPDLLAQLVTGHRCKVKAVEEAVTTLFECGDDEQGCLSRFLLLIFPKSPTSEWGWSRVGWNWQQWWGLADRILLALGGKGAFDMLCKLLKSLETDSGTYLPHQQIWDEKRLALVRKTLCTYGGISQEELKTACEVSLE